MTQALLIMDVQNGIVDRFGAAEEYLDRIVAAQQRAEQAGLLVVLVRVAFTPGTRRCRGGTRASPRWPRTPG